MAFITSALVSGGVVPELFRVGEGGMRRGSAILFQDIAFRQQCGRGWTWVILVLLGGTGWSDCRQGANYFVQEEAQSSRRGWPLALWVGVLWQVGRTSLGNDGNSAPQPQRQSRLLPLKMSAFSEKKFKALQVQYNESHILAALSFSMERLHPGESDLEYDRNGQLFAA